ncbi:unnamed protein product [Amoebophrya sp. A25]|nr:unnamed protein product [Amoebophrya sp. A25]|eukprot:GSA25T00000513001.1
MEEDGGDHLAYAAGVAGTANSRTGTTSSNRGWNGGGGGQVVLDPSTILSNMPGVQLPTGAALMPNNGALTAFNNLYGTAAVVPQNIYHHIGGAPRMMYSNHLFPAQHFAQPPTPSASSTGPLPGGGTTAAETPATQQVVTGCAGVDPRAVANAQAVSASLFQEQPQLLHAMAHGAFGMGPTTPSPGAPYNPYIASAQQEAFLAQQVHGNFNNLRELQQRQMASGGTSTEGGAGPMGGRDQQATGAGSASGLTNTMIMTGDHPTSTLSSSSTNPTEAAQHSNRVSTGATMPESASATQPAIEAARHSDIRLSAVEDQVGGHHGNTTGGVDEPEDMETIQVWKVNGEPVEVSVPKKQLQTFTVGLLRPLVAQEIGAPASVVNLLDADTDAMLLDTDFVLPGGGDSDADNLRGRRDDKDNASSPNTSSPSPESSPNNPASGSGNGAQSGPTKVSDQNINGKDSRGALLKQRSTSSASGTSNNNLQFGTGGETSAAEGQRRHLLAIVQNKAFPGCGSLADALHQRGNEAAVVIYQMPKEELNYIESDTGDTFLHRYAREERVPVVDSLVNSAPRFAQINHVNKNGETALHIACYVGNAHIVEKILSCPWFLNFSQKDLVDNTAFHYGMFQAQEAIKKLFAPLLLRYTAGFSARRLAMAREFVQAAQQRKINSLDSILVSTAGAILLQHQARMMGVAIPGVPSTAMPPGSGAPINMLGGGPSAVGGSNHYPYSPATRSASAQAQSGTSAGVASSTTSFQEQQFYSTSSASGAAVENVLSGVESSSIMSPGVGGGEQMGRTARQQQLQQVVGVFPPSDTDPQLLHAGPPGDLAPPHPHQAYSPYNVLPGTALASAPASPDAFNSSGSEDEETHYQKRFPPLSNHVLSDSGNMEEEQLPHAREAALLAFNAVVRYSASLQDFCQAKKIEDLDIHLEQLLRGELV